MDPEILTVNGRPYTVEKLLGKGKGGYSYLVSDGSSRYVLKQIHHEPRAYYQFGDKLAAERHDYGRLKAIGIPMPELLEVDEGTERILKEYIDGPTIFDLVCREEVREDCFAQMQAMCALLYPANTNIDYFPTNFVVQEGRLFYVDYECNDFMAEWSFENWGVRYWSKTPEFLAYLEEHAG